MQTGNTTTLPITQYAVFLITLAVTSAATQVFQLQ